MKYNPTETCCTVPVNNESPLPGLCVRLEMLNAMLADLTCAVAELHNCTFGDTATPDVNNSGGTISAMVDNATEAARTSLNGLQAYLNKL